MMKFRRLALIGCGLMGGSFALALRRAGLVQQIVGFSASERTRNRATELGVLDFAVNSAAQAVQGADLVLLAVPVGAVTETLRAIAPALDDDSLLMDVGSTKCDVVAAARMTLGEHLPCFVPAHPITGKELAGIDHADAMLYQDQLAILTPLPSCGESQLGRARAIWAAIGSRVHELTPQAHDEVFAAVSHLPHLLAFAYMNGLAQQPHCADYLALAGPGFRDFSRIAASDPAIWHDILRSNKEDVLAQVSHFRQALEQLETAMKRDDGTSLHHLIANARNTRSGWQPARIAQDS